MGGGTPCAAHQAPLVAPTHFRHSCAPSPSFLRPLPSFLRRQESGDFPVWRAALPHPAGRPRRITPEHAEKTTLNTGLHPSPTPTLFPNSSLPPFRGEVRWGVERREPRTKPRSQRRLTSVIPAPHPRHSCAPSRHSCAGRNQATSQFGARRGAPPPRRPPTSHHLRTNLNKSKQT